jgi:hypothetical protein
MVIPAMDHIDQVLASQSLNKALDASIRVALTLAKKTLNRYYTLTDSSEVYRIAMSMSCFLFFCCCHDHPNVLVLHPRHKLAYFAKAGWEDDWIETARNIVRTEFDRSYSKAQEERHDNDNVYTITQTVRSVLFLIQMPFLIGFHTGIPQHF